MFRRCTVFIDDDIDLLNLLKSISESAGIETYCFSTHKNALEKVENIFPAVIFIDYMMDEADGITLLRHIKKIIPQSLIIMMTGAGDETVAVQSIKSGAEDYLIKPVNPQKLLETIDSAFKKFFSSIINLNEKYEYPLNDQGIIRYEFLRSVYSGAVKNIKEACRYFSFSRQDFYNYEKRFKMFGTAGLLKKKDFDKIADSIKTCERNSSISTLNEFIDRNDSVQMKLEMLREAATTLKPNICSISVKYGFTRESFYQIYQRFKNNGLITLTEKKKGRPRKKSEH